MGELQTSRIIDNARLTAEREAVDKAAEGLPDRLRSSGVLAKGPPQEQYDYQGADLNGVSFAEKEGGVDLPLKFSRGVVFAGRDPVTGELYQRRADPNRFGAAANEKLSAAYINTEKGPSPDVMDGAVPAVMEHLQNGGTPEDMDFPVNGGIKEQAVEATKIISSQQVIANELRALPDVEEEVSESDTPSLTLDDMKADLEFLNATSLVGEYHKNDLRVGGADIDLENITPEDIAENGVEEMAAIYGSVWKMSEIILAVERGDMPPEVQQAYLTMAQKYEQFTPWSWDVAQGTVTGLINDAPLFVGLGRLGKG